MDAFELLGIDRNADTKQIRIAYRTKARAAHPDLGGNADAFVRVHRAFSEARAFRAATKVTQSRSTEPDHQDVGTPRPSWPKPPRSQPSRSPRYDLAEIAYRFELGRPGHTAQSFIEAVDAELYPTAAPLQLPPNAVELVSYLIDSAIDLPLVVAAIVRQIDAARSH